MPAQEEEVRAAVGRRRPIARAGGSRAHHRADEPRARRCAASACVLGEPDAQGRRQASAGARRRVRPAVRRGAGRHRRGARSFVPAARHERGGRCLGRAAGQSRDAGHRRARRLRRGRRRPTARRPSSRPRRTGARRPTPSTPTCGISPPARSQEMPEDEVETTSTLPPDGAVSLDLRPQPREICRCAPATRHTTAASSLPPDSPKSRHGAKPAGACAAISRTYVRPSTCEVACASAGAHGRPRCPR